MAIDHQTEQPCDCFGQVTINCDEQIPEDKLQLWHKFKLPLHRLDLTMEDLKHVIPISKEEYENNQLF